MSLIRVLTIEICCFGRSGETLVARHGAKSGSWKLIVHIYLADIANY